MRFSDRNRVSLTICGFSWVAAFFASVFITAAAQAQWTEYGGPGQGFTADSTGLAKEWPAQGPPRLWSRELGKGYSSILADDGRLYTMYRRGDEEHVISLDAASGATLWEQAYESSPVSTHHGEYGDGPNATPLLTGGRLYTIGVAGVMHCLDARTGKVIWSRKLWTEPRDRHPHRFGYSASPIEYKNTIITAVGEEGRSIVALNKDDGKIVFEALDYANSYATPAIMHINGEDQLVAFMGTEAIGADPDTGQLKWEYPIRNQWEHNISGPVLVDDTLFISTLEAGSRGIKFTELGSKTVVEEVWSTRKIRVLYAGWVRIGDYVYGSSGDIGNYLLAAVHAKTGKIAWRKRGFGHAHLVYTDGRVIVLDEFGTLALATATPDDLTIHSKVKVLETPSWTPPTIAGKRLFARDVKTIVALDLG
ncbi:MAG: PQQ-binding-like beta-propeller repeat protein [Phycisphaerales bacterium]|nr:MAG: PQQ-binding-like beta-propeller repeat protein [Phycisphaerales bacterium]